jgi:hypothetical protein
MKNRNNNFWLGIVAIALVFAMMAGGCDRIIFGNEEEGEGTVGVTFIAVIANGSESQTTTALALVFSEAITELSANDISLSGVSGVSKGALTGAGPSYTLPISGFSAGGRLTVKVTKKGYTISGATQTVTIYYNGGSGGGPIISVTIVGTPGVGNTLEANVQKNFDASLTYQWMRGSSRITGATGRTYTITAADSGNTLTVVVSYGDGNVTSPGLEIPATSQTPTISVTIIGTPGVGMYLEADVQKNFVGEVSYQWLANNSPIPDETYNEYEPQPKDSGKKISVRVTAGTGANAKSATSAQVTIPSFTYTVGIGNWRDTYWAYAEIGEAAYPPEPDSGFTVQWYRNGTPIPGATEPNYELQDIDAGKTIKARISGYGQNVYSADINVPAVDTPLSIEFNNNVWGLGSEEINKIAREIEEVYNNNIAGFEDVIVDGVSKAKYLAWCVDYIDSKNFEEAKIINKKLHILLSAESYNSYSGDKTTRLNQLGLELRMRANAPQYISLGKEEERCLTLADALCLTLPLWGGSPVFVVCV